MKRPLCIYVVLALLFEWCVASPCDRTPTGIYSSKIPGDNGYGIKVSGNPDKYVPGEIYTVSLQGWKTTYSVQKFTMFTLMVEPSDPNKGISYDTTGTFQLYEGDGLIKFSDECLNAVVQTSSIPKEEVQVRWTAPPPGSGCIQFKAALVEHRESWFMDDGGLTLELCEEETDNMEMQPPVLSACTSCDEAKYEVMFEGLWSRHTHPKDFPQNDWLTHFSDIIGASHNPDYTIWEVGGISSDGLREVAQWGSTRKMESELKTQSEHIRTIIKARGLFYPTLNGKTYAVFRVDNKHHVMSLVSMLGPSPDWIVGTSKMELCLENGSWIGHKTLNLYPIDAGTDSGITYMDKSPTYPRDRIRRITSSFPNNPKSPFFSPAGEQIQPVARLTINRQRVYQKSCDDNSFISDPGDEPSPDCAVGEWAAFSPCSVTCGMGIQMRQRHYIDQRRARKFGCNTQLVEKEMCPASILSCDGSINRETNSTFRCAVSAWTDWSECSVTCGKGVQMKTRDYLDPMAHKICTLHTVEKQTCEMPECVDEFIPPECAVTKWSQWSPCTVSCGTGMKYRTRQYLDLSSRTRCRIDLTQHFPCTAEKSDCSLDDAEAKVICMEPQNVGPCRGYFPRWYFNAQKGMCLQFIYGGCRGNRNKFETYEQCKKTCEMGLLGGPPHGPPSSEDVENLPDDLPPEDNEPIDCMITEWSDWTPCSVTCGKGRKERSRMIKVQAENGGKECPKKLRQRKRCSVKPCSVAVNHHLN